MTRTVSILLLLITLLSINSIAQKQESFKSLKKRSSVSSARSLLDDANELKSANPKEALDKVEDALAMSIAQNDEQGEGKCYVLIGEINEGIQEWKLALENYNQAYQKLSINGVTTTEFKKTLQGLGAMNLKLKNYEESLKYYRQALTLNLNQNERSERLLDVSEVYYQMGLYNESLQALTEIPQAKKVGNQSIETRKQNQQAKIYAMTNNLSKSQDAFQNSLNSARAEKKPDVKQEESIQDTKEEIAGALHEQKRYDDEIAIRKQAIDYNLENKNIVEVTKDKVAIGKTLETKGENKAALRELEEAASIADTINNPKEQANAYLVLAQLYEKNDRNAQALSTYRKYSDAIGRNDKKIETRLTEKSELIKKQKDIEGLSGFVSVSQREETIKEETLFRQQIIIYGLLLIIAIVGLTSYFIYKNAQASKLANQLLALKSLRSQMNPHFIFNALNSVNQFISEQDERTANRFLSEFSQLMRLVLENSQEDFIPFRKEQEILTLYLKLEHYRFRDKFDYEIKIDEGIDADHIEVPPMLTQPYIENAVWHGLRYKDEKGKLLLSFRQERDNLIVEINDNGIGRKKSSELKTENQKKHKSTGLKNINERLAIINQVYKTNYRVQVEDPLEGSGTHVRIYLPIRNSVNRLS
ncbi:MAG TPA: histidine kinase [Cyclobacteriaceae bacterium]|jgi:tetratricopeptide (TPR) repeat protein|nr:histidine kinase [Cyclobacteriaceae bacterium]